MSWPKSNPNSGYVKITNDPNFIKQNTQRNQGKEKRN